jgi:hypothetical protein
MPDLNDRDVELLSAYLDGALTPAERAALEARLQADAALRRDLDGLRQTVALVRALPRLAAPRSFALTPAQAGLVDRPRPLPFFVSSAFSALSAAAAVVLLALGSYLLLEMQPGAAPAAAPVMVAAAPTSPPGLSLPAARAGITPLPTLALSGAQDSGSADSARALEAPVDAQADNAATAPSVLEAAPAGGAADAALAPQPTAPLLTPTAAPTSAPPEIAQDAAAAAEQEAPSAGVLAEEAAPPPAPAETPPLAPDLSPLLLAGGLALLALAAVTTLARRRGRR